VGVSPRCVPRSFISVATKSIRKVIPSSLPLCDSDAGAAAAASQRALVTHTRLDGVTVRVHMGLHTSEPQRSAEGYVGLDVHHATRIMSAGHGSQVLLSQTTRDLVERALPKG
jgi:class 3 adenylate cyclase